MNSSALLSLAFTQLWQLTLLIAVVAIVARAFCRNRPHVAMLLWLLVLAKCVTPPIVAAPFGLFCRTEEATPAVTQSSEEPAPFAFFEKVQPEPALPEPEITYSYPVAETVEIQPEPARFSSFDWLAIGWGIGTVLVVLIASLRVTLCMQQIRRTTVDAPAELNDRLQQLRTQLGIRRRVSLIITSSAIGPAIVGLFRLRVVVPEVIARDGADSLEPILAHELIHVRRGDLWIGLLNLCARGLWWFHPLVWWVSKQINRDTERACDEEVLAALNCRPGDYARSLLRVLEQKNSLKAMPAFPGVRPVEITSQRMERIMSLRQGSRSTGSWRRRLLFVLAAAVTLPGAVISQDAKPRPLAPAAPKEKKRQVVVKATIVETPVGLVGQLISAKRRTAQVAAAMPKPAPAQAAPNFGFQLLPDGPGGNLVQPTSLNLGVMQRTPFDKPLESPATPKAEAPSITGNLVTSNQATAILHDLQRAKKVEFLSAPKLICNDGQQASLMSAGEPGLTLKVTPAIRPDGINLAYSFEVQNVSKKEPSRKETVESQVKVGRGFALVQSGMVNRGRETVLVVELEELKLAPAAKPANSFFSDQGIPGKLVSQSSSSAVIKHPQTVMIKSLIAQSSKVPVFAQPVPSSQITLSTRRGSDKPVNQDAVAYTLPVSQDRHLHKQLSKAPDHILSRPRMLTLIGQRCSIEVGQEVVPKDKNDDGRRGIRMHLTPTKNGDNIRVSGELIVHIDPHPQTTYELKNLELAPNKITLLQIKRPAPEPDVLLALSGQYMPQSDNMIEVELNGAVRNPGVYEIPEGSNLEHLVDRAGGLREDATGTAMIERKSYATPLVDGVPQSQDKTPAVVKEIPINPSGEPPLELKPKDKITVYDYHLERLLDHFEQRTTVAGFEGRLSEAKRKLTKHTQDLQRAFQAIEAREKNAAQVRKEMVDRYKWNQSSSGRTSHGSGLVQSEYRSPLLAEPTAGESRAAVRIEVAGEVRKPGTYELPAGSNIIDAISCAGGLSSKAGIRLHVEPSGLTDGAGSIRQLTFGKDAPVVDVASLLTHQEVPTLKARDRIVVHRDETEPPASLLPSGPRTETHSIAEISGASLETRVVRRLRRLFHPDIWDSGNNLMQLHAKRSGAVVVSAESPVHVELAHLLNRLRAECLETRAYPVADLVVPNGNRTSPEATEAQLQESVAELQARVAAIAPTQWGQTGGPGSIRFAKGTLSLIVRAHRTTHDEIGQLFLDLRQQLPGQVSVETILAVAPEKQPLKVKLTGGVRAIGRDTSMVAERIGITGTRLMAPKLTLFSGQQAEVKTGSIALKIRAKVEGQNIVLTAMIGGETKAWVVPNGHHALADVTSAMRNILGERATGNCYALKLKATCIGELETDAVPRDAVNAGFRRPVLPATNFTTPSMGSASNYSWLRGIVKLDPRTDTYEITYSLTGKDKHGGTMALAPHASLANLENGDPVHIRGKVGSRNANGQPQYQIHHIRKLTPKQVSAAPHDSPKASKEPLMIMVTPRIIIQEEEEELMLGEPVK